jgi:hypothetical protein
MTGSANKTAKKPRGRPFEPGNNANPNGRPRGALSWSTAFFNSIGAGAIEGLVRKTLDEAKSGNMAAVKLIFDRALPAPKGRPIALALPAVSKPEDIPTALAAIIAAMGEGLISPEEAAAVSAVIEGQRRAFEIVALELRVAELEKKAATIALGEGHRREKMKLEADLQREKLTDHRRAGDQSSEVRRKTLAVTHDAEREKMMERHGREVEAVAKAHPVA